MARIHMLQLFGLIFIISCESILSYDVKKFPLVMPNVHPDRDELYLCTPVRIVDDKTFYIVGFEPKAHMNVTHHMLVFGCSEPGTYEEVWDCGEMAAPSGNSKLTRANPCNAGSNVIYAWARNAKSLKLPPDVGFQVGGTTNVKYVVLQIHYSHKFPDNQRDNSGLKLYYTEEPQTKLAGVLLLATGGVIPPRSVTNMETLCTINENKEIHPFAYRTHTHSLGRAVSGYSVRRDQNGVDHWTLIGKRNPMTPQMFYPVFDQTKIKQGDRLAARCTMDATLRDRSTQVGPTNADEMCNFYIMYYVENGKPLDMKYCSSEGPPYFYWSNENNDLNHIPQLEASFLE